MRQVISNAVAATLVEQVASGAEGRELIRKLAITSIDAQKG